MANRLKVMRVLVLCTGNSCRSQMAEGFLRHLGGKAIEAFSAGLEPKGVHPLAIQVMAESGIDLSSHQSTPAERYLRERFDYVITVCDNAAARCPTFHGGGVKLHWPFDDPAEATGSEDEVLSVFRRVRDEIETAVSSWLDGLRRASGS